MIMATLKKTPVIFLLIASLLLVSCTHGQKHGEGAILGGMAGAAIGQMAGRSTEATLIGILAGAAFGFLVGQEMDRYDRARMNTVYETAPSGTSQEWVNPDTGNRYEVVPQPARRDPQTQRYCRDAEVLAVIDGKAERTKATACRDNSGQWVVQ